MKNYTDAALGQLLGQQRAGLHEKYIERSDIAKATKYHILCAWISHAPKMV